MARQETRKQSGGRPTVRMKSHNYQPNKAELEAPVKIDVTPEALTRAVLRPVNVVEDPDA